MMKRNKSFLAGLFLGALAGVLATGVWQAGRIGAQAVETPHAPLHGAQLDWLPRELDLAVERIEAQLRGMDAAMWEIGHRFDELYHAGQERNWPLADYHLEKIEAVMTQGLERRPARAASAEPFMNEVLPEVAELLQQREADAFERAMGRLRTGCMQCHVAEDVPHFIPQFPQPRPAPVPPQDIVWDAPSAGE